MQPNPTYHYFGLLAVTLLLLGLIFVLLKWPGGRHRTFSQHVAGYRRAIVYYALLFSVVLPLLILFFVQWFAPMFQLSGWFNGWVIASSVLQYACTLIPEVGGWKTRCHVLLAGLSGICLVPALALLLASDVVPAWQKPLVGLGLLTMLIVIALVAVKRGKQTHSLLLQSGYFVAFFVPVLAVSYL